MKRKPCYFKKYDLIIYIFLVSFFFSLISYTLSLKNEKGNKIEIYVDNELKYVYNLQKEQKNYFVDTNLGGVNVEIKDMKVRVTSSNSPLKICVKQGWISNVNDAIIGVPDRLLIKITGEKDDNDLDAIIR